MVPKRTYVLVVDDLPDMAESTADLLTLWGYDAAACTSGAGALQCARACPPAAVLLDLAMPRMDGFAFARAFRALDGCHDVPLIALSGYACPASSDRARDAGIDHYLLKPADADRLKNLLASSVRRVVVPARRPGSRWTSRRLRVRSTRSALVSAQRFAAGGGRPVSLGSFGGSGMARWGLGWGCLSGVLAVVAVVVATRWLDGAAAWVGWGLFAVFAWGAAMALYAFDRPAPPEASRR